MTPTPNSILFGLDAEHKPLKGALQDLHALCWKMIIWKFTAKELDPEKPEFILKQIFQLAMHAMGVALRALQQRSIRTQAMSRIDDNARDGDLREAAYPFAVGMEDGKLILHRDFANTLEALNIAGMEKNPICDHVPPPPSQTQKKRERAWEEQDKKQEAENRARKQKKKETHKARVHTDPGTPSPKTGAKRLHGQNRKNNKEGKAARLATNQ